MQTLPNRASDAGPDYMQEPAPDWVDYLYFAADEISDCRRLNHDNLQQELTLRQEAISRAIEHLQAALAALPQQRQPEERSELQQEIDHIDATMY